MVAEPMTEGNKLISRHQDQVSCNLEELVVLLSVQSGKYYHMNAVGSRIWELLQAPQTLKTLCDLLVDEFDISLEQCQDEVQEFIAYLQSNHLVKLTEAPES